MAYFRFNSSKLKDRRKNLRKNSTDLENILWQRIRNKQISGFKFWRQYSVGAYILDFYCPQKRLAIELDGGQHGNPDNVDYDNERTKYLNMYNIKVLRFWNNEILNNLENVLQKINEELNPPLLD